MSQKLLLLQLLLLIFLLYGCYPQTNESFFLDKANQAIEVDFNQAKDYLDKIENPNFLNEQNFALYTYLSCRVADSLNVPLPLNAEIEKATKWYNDKGNDLAAIRMLLYLGRSMQYNQQNYKVIESYLKALALAKEKGYANEAGYINSYMGDFYTETGDLFAAIKKYMDAGDFFNKSGNKQSQAYAYRDVGRSWALVDSTDLAMNAFNKAEYIAKEINNTRIQSTILNGKGNIYGIIGKLDLAEEALLRALALDTIEVIPSINALMNIYIEQKKYEKAHYYLDSLSNTNLSDEHRNALHYIYYLLNESQGNYKNALENLQKVFEFYQYSLVNESKISFYELENRYSNVLLMNQIDKLKITVQYYVIGLIFLLLLLLSSIAITQYKKIKYNKLISCQDKEIQSLMTKFFHLRNELRDKETIINTTLVEKDEKYKQKEKEVELLSRNLKELRRNRLLNSDIGKKLRSLASSVKPKTSTPLITPKMWKQIENEVKEVYPEFELKIAEIHNQELLESEWLYCCLLLFNFDGNEEGILLNINPQSARTRKSRIRKKLGIALENETSLYDYFINRVIYI